MGSKEVKCKTCGHASTQFLCDECGKVIKEGSDYICIEDWGITGGSYVMGDDDVVNAEIDVVEEDVSFCNKTCMKKHLNLLLVKAVE